MAITFTEKQQREQTAAGCVGLLRSMAEDPCRRHMSNQEFFETEYVALYEMLQQNAFTSTGEVKWILLTAMMQCNTKVDVYKSDLGIYLQYGDDLVVEVASLTEAVTYVQGVKVFETPSVIHAKEGKVPRYLERPIQVITENRVAVRM